MDHDAIWDQIKKLIRENAPREEIHNLRRQLTVEYLKKENDNARFKIQAEFITTKCCPECEKLDGTTVPILEEINNPTLPYHNCTRPYTGCVCLYTITSIRDEKGRLIPIDPIL